MSEASRPVLWMVAASMSSWLAATVMLERRTSLDVLFGMLGPLAVASVTWVLVQRAHRRDPAGVTAVLVASFFGKMLFFAAYVALMLRVVSVQPMPFVVSFTCYFVALYFMDLMFMRRLFSRRSN